MPTRLLLIAHAPTAATRRAAFPLDEPIEEASLPELALLVDLAAQPDRAYAAPERRSQQTADGLGLRAETQLLLADINLGRWRGKSFDDMLEEGPEVIAAWTSDPAFRGHGGESVTELLARVAPWLDRQREEGGTVVAVTHPAVVRAAIVLAIGSPAASFWRIDVTPLARVDLWSDGRRWVLRSLSAAD